MCLETGEKKLEVGAMVSGKITGIAKFGAFVEVTPKKTGLVHISEISNGFVKNISDHLKEGQIVNVKILGISPSGKIELSIRQAENPDLIKDNKEQFNKSFGEKSFHRKAVQPDKTNSFEDMMAKFKQISDEKMSDLKRDSKHGGGFNRRNTNKY